MFVLVVEGDSMINEGILDGDSVIVKQQNTAENGDIVVAMTEDDEATVKTFYKEKDHIRLQPENDYMEPIILTKCNNLRKSDRFISEFRLKKAREYDPSFFYFSYNNCLSFDICILLSLIIVL